MRLTLFLISLLLSEFIFARSFRIAGYVYDKETAEVLPYCNIHVVNTNRGTTTNAEGYFSIEIDDANVRLKFQYMGYDSHELNLKLFSDTTLIIRMRPAVLHLDAVIVTPDQLTEAEELILRASKQKNDFRNLLNRYSCYSYTKTSFQLKERPGVYGGIMEAFSEIYYRSPDHFNEIIRSQRQTANIPRAINYLSGDAFLDINSDRIILGNKSITGPTAPDAVYYYHFEIIDTLYQDHERLIRIELSPKNNNLPLMKGSLVLSEKSYFIQEIDVLLNQACDYDFFRSISILQRYISAGEGIYLPYYSKRKSLLHIDFPGYPGIIVTKENWRENYAVNENAEIPQRPMEKVTIERKFDFEDVPMHLPPLASGELTGYARIDSLVRYNPAISNLTKIVKILDKYESANKSSLGNFSDFFRFNRVEGAHLGFAVNTENKPGPFSVYSGIAYGVSDSKIKYFITPKYVNITESRKIAVSFSHYSILDYTDTYAFFPVWANTFSALSSANDYFNYYYSKGNRLNFTAAGSRSKFMFNFFSEKHISAGKNINRSLTGGRYRDVMDIPEGICAGLAVSFEYSSAVFRKSSIYNRFIPNQRFREFKIFHERGIGLMGSNFSYEKYAFTGRMRQNLASRVLIDLECNLVYTSSNTPAQKTARLTSGNLLYNRFRSFRTLPPNYHYGLKKYEFFSEINFTDIFLRSINKLFKINSELSLILNHGWSGSKFDRDILKNELFTEAGFGINKIFGFFKLEFVWALNKIDDSYPFAFNIKIDDFDVF